MNQKIRYQTGFMAIFVLFLLFSCNNESKQSSKKTAETQYTCPMHPQIIKDEPGSCPICKMDLVPMHQHAVKMEVDSDLADLIQPVNQTITSNINTIKVRESSKAVNINLDGKVTYNTNTINTIASRVSGRIEKLYVKYNLQKVQKGQKLMEIYSEDLAAVQQEILFLKANGDIDLLAHAKNKLRLLGVSDAEINRVLKTGKVDYKVAIYSNYSGYLLDANSDMMENNANSPITIKEGQYVNTGDLLFKIFDAQNVWAEFFVNVDEGKNLKIGDQIMIKKGNKTSLHSINLLQPFYKDGFNYQVIRVYLSNQNQQFKIGEILSGEINLTPK
jgi:Cu(I)/Ag(I) efflux system membrane fusion protein